MGSETLNDRLAAYRIGQKIRGLRADKGLALTQLWEHSRLSAGMLSKVERRQIFPTLPTLTRIALVFGAGLEHFFTEGEVVRRKDRLSLPGTRGGAESFYFKSLDLPVTERPLETYLARFPAGAPASTPDAHPGVEVIYVMTGTLGLVIHGETHRLEAGDSIYFESDFEHSYACPSDRGCRALVVVCAKAGGCPQDK